MKSADYARDLLRLAEYDFKTAEIGLEHGAPLNTVCFHLQQTVEKLLKAVIVTPNLEYPLTHDLENLLDLAAKECPELTGFRKALAGFATYAVEIRYDPSLYPSPEETQAAMQTTKRIREVVRAWLPPEALP
jgi:HEPN domain-containing protein